MSDTPGLTESEREVLKVLWDQGPATVRAILTELEARGRHWAYSTVATLIQRMSAKGFITTDSAEVPFIYAAAVSRDQLLGRRLRDAANELCDGSAAPLMLALVQGGHFSPDELARFRRLLDEAAQRQTPGPSKNRPPRKSKPD